MPFDQAQLIELINQPNETLSIELKSWIDPGSNSGIEKIVKACLAMRNNNGGSLLIGFDNEKGNPIIEGAPEDVLSDFHVDKIQGLLTKYSSESFEVYIHYPKIDGNTYVVIEIPTGVKTPVATKSALIDENKNFIRENKIFVRTLNANNTPSTAEANYKDWPVLMEKCFDNREADVGRFIRRHLSNASLLELKELFLSSNDSYDFDNRSINEVDLEFIKSSFKRFEFISNERDLNLPNHGSMEVSVKIEGEINQFSANTDFLNLVSATNPGLTGWPVWDDTRAFVNSAHRPFVFEGFWEAFVASFGEGHFDHLDYWRISPEGRFYLYRAFQDDIGSRDSKPVAGTVLDYGLVVLRAAECIIVAIAFAKAMQANDDSKLRITFRWRGLRGRTLSSWANPERYIDYNKSAYQDEVITSIELPVDTASGTVAGYVESVTSPLFEVFEGFELSSEIIDEFTSRLIQREL